MTRNCNAIFIISLLASGFFAMSALAVSAATLSLTPGTNVYNTGATFTARVVVNSAGQSINAAEGTLRYNPSELQVVSVNRNGSIFNLWITEPTFSNAAGTVNFSGGLPSGYTGSSGSVMNVTFRAVGSGAAKVSFSNGSVLANDGRGSNVLSGMSGGTYTIQAASSEPEAEEVIVEYVAPANTPSAPLIQSSTHPDSTSWYDNTQAELNWSVPGDVTSVRTLLDTNPTSVPNRVYDNPINSLSLNLDEGVQYLHVQFRNSEGWGRVGHYRLAVDTTVPSAIEVALRDDADLTSPQQELVVSVEDEGSEVNRFMVRVDADEPFEYVRENASSTLPLPELEPGYHTVVVEAFDQAGNSIVGTFSFSILAFDRPEFTEYPTQIGEDVIPVIRGLTRPNATVELYFGKLGTEESLYTVQAGEDGVFTFIPENRLNTGVYELRAKAIDEFGAHSEMSETIRIAVQQPGFVRIGSLLVSYLSVLIPLLALLALSGFLLWYVILYTRRFKKRVQVESFEALEIAKREFSSLRNSLNEQETALAATRKTKKLTKAETAMVSFMHDALDSAEEKIEKEVADVTELTKGEDK